MVAGPRRPTTDHRVHAGSNPGRALINCGVVARQTVMHCHMHVIPRRQGDSPNPRGGIRYVIPGKADYDATILQSRQTRDTAAGLSCVMRSRRREAAANTVPQGAHDGTGHARRAFDQRPRHARPATSQNTAVQSRPFSHCVWQRPANIGALAAQQST